MKTIGPTVLLVLSAAVAAFAEDPDAIVKRLHDEGARCHYVLSICSDTVRAEGALARIRTENAGNDGKASGDAVTAAEARVARQVDLLTRAAAAVRQRRTSVPDCFRHCERLKDYR